MPTIRDIARAAGVSIGTVSNVLNRPSYVSPEIRSRVQEVMAELDYTPTANARQYRPGRQRTLAMSVADMANPFFVDICIGAEEEASRRGLGMVFSNASEDAEREVQNLTLLENQRVHGIIVTPVREDSPRLAELARRGIPMMFVDRVAENMQAASLIVDHNSGGRLVGEHLVERGYIKTAFLGDLDIATQVAPRFEGFCTALANAGWPAPLHLSASNWTLAAGRQAAAMFLGMGTEDRPEAIFCANDMLALGVQRGLAGSGLRVPEDIALVGYDDLEWAEAASVPLTTVHQPRHEMGREAVRLLMQQIDEPDTAKRDSEMLLPQLVVRASTIGHQAQKKTREQSGAR